MPQATRQGDKNTGHDSCPPTELSEGSDTVFINGKPAGRMGDAYVIHSCKTHAPHIGVIAAGSGTVFINGKPAGRVDDPVSCGGNVAEGSDDVFVGG